MKEMMKQKMMNRFHKRNSSTSSYVDFKSGEKLDFKFSSLQALQIPTGWDKLTLSLISVETDKTVTKTGKSSVCNGNCRWTETLSESIWISHDDPSKELQQCLYKLLISKGSTRSSILGEVTVNLANYLSSETFLPVALPLKKCDHGTILQVAIQCLNPRPNLRWQDINSVAGDVNSEYSDLDNTSDVPHGTNFNNAGSSSTNSIPDTSHTRGLHSRDTSLSTVRSYHSFDSMDDSFGRESSVSNLSEAAIDLIGRPESTGLVNVYDSPRSNRSGKNLLNQRQDSGKVSHIPASPLRTYNSSEFVLEAEGSTPEELRAEARSWERNARKLKVDLNLSRSETINQTKNLENVTMELAALQKECKGLKDEIKHLKVLLNESAVKERDADSLKIQVQNKNDIQAELEETLKFQKDLNEDLSLQLNKTQESNLELVSVLQELEETIEKQRLEIKIFESSSEQPSGDNWKREAELQKFLESQKRLENTIFHLEKTLEEKSQTLLDNETECREKLVLKDQEINNLKAKLSEAVAVPLLIQTESQTIETHDLDEEVKALKEKVVELERDCNELTDENLDLLFKLKESNTDLLTDGSFIKYSAQLSDLKKENNRLEESLKAMQQELDVTKESHVSGNKILETKLRESQDNFLKLLKILEDLEAKLSSMIDGIESKEKMFNSEIDDLHLKFKEHVEKCVNGENKLNQMYSDKVVEVEALKQEVEHLNLQISATHDERDRMASEAVLEMHADKDKMVNSIAEVEEKLRLSEEKVETIQVEYEKKISDLTAEIATSMQNHDELVANHAKLTELLENTRSSEEKLKNTVGELSANIKSSEYKIVQFTEENSSLKNSLYDMKFENERLSASFQVISDDYQQLKEENTSLLQKEANMQKSVIELEDHKQNKIVMEEKLLRFEGDLTAREALGAQDAELEIEVGRLKQLNSQLQCKINRLQEEKDEYIKKMQLSEEQKQEHEAISIGSDSTSRLHEEMKLAEDVEVNTVDSRIQSLEIALAEALEANEIYKLQLKSFMSTPVRELDIPVKQVSNEEINKEHKNIVSSLERELSELQERYLNMSLKYAEVEAQREELVLKLKATGPGRSWFS